MRERDHYAAPTSGAWSQARNVRWLSSIVKRPTRPARIIRSNLTWIRVPAGPRPHDIDRTFDKEFGMQLTERVSRAAFVGALIGAIFLTGCASPTPDSSGASSPLGSGAGVTATDASRLTRSGFLSDYGRLKPTSWGGGLECWRETHFDARRFDKVLISRIQVTLAPKPGEASAVDPADLKTLTDYFHDALANALKPQMAVADRAGPGVVVMRIALTRLVPTGVAESVAGTLVPYGYVVEAGSGVATGRPAGSTPYLGETGIEMQFRDGATGAVIGECRDTEIGRKYAADANAGATGALQTWASGYLNSFEQWSYAKDAFDKWATLVAQRFAQLRAEAPAR